jgi:hypothetical protein
MIAWAIAILACLPPWAFGTPPHGTQQATQVVLLYDVTSPMSARPSGEIMSLFAFGSDLYRGYSMRIQELGPVHLTPVYEASVPPESRWMGDDRKRIAAIRKFRQETCVQIGRLGSGTREEIHSVLYRTIAAQLNCLADARGPSDRSICVIYSDMLENSQDADFYSASAIAELKGNPQAVIDRLQEITPLHNLRGIAVYVVYEPKSYADEIHFDLVMAMYRRMLEEKGATVRTGANLITH